MKKRNVLVVDDDPDVLSMLERLLKKLEYNPLVAQNGEEAVQIIDTNKIDVVVSDLVMPEMDGMELLKRVKTRKGDIPFLMITGHPTIETAVEAIKKGAYDYLTKPFQVEEVQIKIDRALEKRGLNALFDASFVNSSMNRSQAPISPPPIITASRPMRFIRFATPMPRKYPASL